MTKVKATRRTMLRVGTMLAISAAACLAAPERAAAQDGPRMGEYKLVQVALTTGSVSGLIVLRADGSYELHDMPARSFRGRGTYRYDAGAKRVVWLSGINQEMGRGGTFSTERGGQVHRIALGPRTYAINGD